jgi:hypothetical protein
MRTQDLWSSLSAQPFSYLHGLAVVERGRFMLLDAYLRDCLDDCTLTITRRFRLLDGEGQWYFGQFRRLARRV